MDAVRKYHIDEAAKAEHNAGRFRPASADATCRYWEMVRDDHLRALGLTSYDELGALLRDGRQ